MGNVGRPLSFGFPLPRDEVENLEPYRAPLEGRRNLLRLDFNENTLGPSPRVLDALRKISANEIAIYPEYDGLRELVIENLFSCGLQTSLLPEQVGLFNGVDAAIHSIFHSYGDRGDQLLTTIPTFGYYTPCAQMQGMEIVAIPYQEKDFCFPLKQIRDALMKKPRLLFICNPNNPTGTRLPPEEIIELASSFSETLFVVDELYEAFTGDSVLPLVDFNTTPNLLALRSLSKTAGLAGLRIGFAVGAAEVVDRVSRVTGPYDVNGFAVAAACAALLDQPYTDAYVAEVLKAKEWIKAELAANGIRYHMDGGNYFLLWPDRNATEIESLLRAKGILVRDMSHKPLIEGAIRVSIGTTMQMKEFWKIFLDLS